MRSLIGRAPRVVLGSAAGGLLLVAGALALQIGLVAASAAAPPTAYSGEAGELTTSSASLRGAVYPSNQPTSYYFQYGTSGEYGAQTPPATAGSGKQTVHVSAPVGGLLPYTTYYWRLVAVNASGTASGAQRTFTTKKVPLSFTVAATPTRDEFGQPFSVAGTLSGTGSANHEVVLQANPFPYLAGFRAVTPPQLTNADSGFAFAVPGLPRNAQLRVATVGTPAVNSHVMVELVAVRVTLNVRPTGRRGFARLYGTVVPAELGAQVGFQLLGAHGKPTLIGGTLIAHAHGAFARFSQVVRIRKTGLYRAHVIVVSGAQASNYSRAVLVR